MRSLHRWWLAGVLTLALVAAALTIQIVAASGVTARSGRLTVAAARGITPPGAEVRRDVLVLPGRGTQRLAAGASAPLVGTEAPVATLSPDGTRLAYNSFEWLRGIDWTKSFADEGIETGDAVGVPTIRIHDLATGRDTRLERGSQSFAWRADGALAYAVGDPPAYRANLPFLADVVVRKASGAGAERWSPTPARYHVLGWAGETLLVARWEPGAAPDVVAFDGPGAPRVLAGTSFLLGISPDGTRALLVQSAADIPHPQVRLVRVSDGSVVSSIPVSAAIDPVTGNAMAALSGPGAWVDDHVVASSETGLVVFHVTDDISVEQVLHLDSAAKPDGSLFEPRFADDTRTILAWSGVPGTEPHVQAVQLRCDRYALTCTRSTPVDPAAIPRPVYDLSGGAR